MAQRTWFITGTSSGFGRKLTELLLGRGDRVAATARNLDSLDDLRSRFGEALWTQILDVTDAAAIRRTVDQAFRELGQIDVLVSNAGYGLMGAAEELSDAQIRQQFETNVMGSIQLIRAALPHLRIQGGGRILQISSMAGQIAFPGLSMYHASKWAIEGFCEALMLELAPFNIQLTLVEPGGACTDFAARSMVSAEPMAAYEDTAVGSLRRSLDASDRQFRCKGDPTKMAQAMIASADLAKLPKRLALGSDAYTMVSAALRSRLADLEAQKDLAFSTDIQ